MILLAGSNPITFFLQIPFVTSVRYHTCYCPVLICLVALGEVAARANAHVLTQTDNWHIVSILFLRGKSYGRGNV